MEELNVLEAITDIARDKGINRDRLVEVVQEAIASAARRKYQQYDEIDARIDESNGSIHVYRYRVVTDDVGDPDNEIDIEEAAELDPEAEVGDEVEYEIANQQLRSFIAQTARQMIFQKIREAERETIHDRFKDRVGEILSGVVSRGERGRTFITFNQSEAILYRRDQLAFERHNPGDHVRVILLDVINDPREPSQLVISRTHPLLLIKLFEMEVPEIYEGIVEVIGAVRESGQRAKIAVTSNDPDVDPVGACVGMRGSRVQSVISELRGEKIDIIKWSDDLPNYVANALAPAELSRIKIDDIHQIIEVEVEADQLSLAIGKRGQNVRLASRLIGYRINIKSTAESQLSLEEQIRQRLLASQAELAAQISSEDADPALQVADGENEDRQNADSDSPGASLQAAAAPASSAATAVDTPSADASPSAEAESIIAPSETVTAPETKESAAEATVPAATLPATMPPSSAEAGGAGASSAVGVPSAVEASDAPAEEANQPTASQPVSSPDLSADRD